MRRVMKDILRRKRGKENGRKEREKNVHLFINELIIKKARLIDVYLH